MMETVFILPFIMLVVVLLIYLGWNFRRFALVTNMDRYSVWEQVTPGSPGPDIQRRPAEDRNPRLNNTFFELHDDQAVTLDEWRHNDGYRPQAHNDLRDQQADETYSYFDEFLDRNRGGLRERFVAKHEHISDAFEAMGMTDTMRNKKGHNRLHGDWRYANGIRYDADFETWVPSGYRVTPGTALREVFYIDLDERLERYSDNNPLARAIRDFYMSYPAYRGPTVGNANDNSDTPGNGGGVGSF